MAKHPTKATDPPSDEGTTSTSDDTSEVSSSSDDELDDQGLPPTSDATRSKPRICDVSAHAMQQHYLDRNSAKC